MACHQPLLAQETGPEKYGSTLNVGVGIGYYGYVGYSIPVAHANWEFDVARNFTLAPFITALSYENYYYWGDDANEFRYYAYRRNIIPVGVKGSYYFDQLLGAGSKWDFYLAASLGCAFRSTTWEDGYGGELTVSNGATGVYLDGHIGAEYHFNERLGLLLDLSSGISTICLAVHF
ncbi:MAG: hypothetical protein A3D31_08910 [Candidatus Fluviicola riflensis]|nr:MAG: hypothetical protein CHH17_13320 [Candidatus Fluviicola riflensis]OGS77130.1 MAG: hypothetical protein A3D31_08910 [Candidatus Fluviicola riflensis]OGS82065.1 MAG: hypothetical protein A2724_17855 [Fluviicola sp. RIFCSPHIGHO2_01_FULL_43_53]OGS87759.1 MAG: hypothetical protein A3E30_15290 [Fluviicola sp. RIFCSPHIGHO2_12_FULL_43_24]